MKKYIIILSLILSFKQLPAAKKRILKEVPMTLHEAAEEGDLVRVLDFIEKGAGPSERDKIGDYPLHSATRGGNLEIVKALIKEGAQVNAGGPEGETALHLAAAFGKIKIVKELLQYYQPLGKFDIDKTDNKGRTPLSVAKKEGKTEVVKLLSAAQDQIQLSLLRNVLLKLKKKLVKLIGKLQKLEMQVH